MTASNQLEPVPATAGAGGRSAVVPVGGTVAAEHALRYRPDIDGLRAVAVLPVVLYHLGISLFPGGFVGVDVFFVISGYLITSLISAEMSEGTYSIARFYVRRARRIFPALFFLCAVCTLFVMAVGLPSDVKSFSNSLAAATLFASNLYFYFTADYFAAGADTQPLLHTWSLAVEEQFYIFFPLILLVIRRYCARRERLIVTALALISLGVSAWLVQADRAAAFYLLHARAWELLVGALLAIGAVPPVRSRLLAAGLGILGLVLIALSVFLYRENMAFPGLAALVPCLGAALVIHCGSDASLLASRMLAFGPVRFVGLISYSLYLWHWPIDVVSRYLAFWNGWDPDGKPHKLAALAASFACATLSWHFVERPFRQRPHRFGPVATLSASIAVMAGLVAVAGVIHPLSARLWSMPDDARRILAVLDENALGSMRARSCLLRTSAEDFSRFDQAACLRLSDSRPNWLLVGDSHAADLWAGISRVNPEVNLLQATATGCKPVLDAEGERQCTDLMRFMFDSFVPRYRFDTILLSARWNTRDVEHVSATARALTAFAERVVVLGPRVEYKHDLPWLLAAGAVKSDRSIVDRFRSARQKQTDRVFAERLRGDGIQYVSLYRAICPGGQCRVTDKEGLPLAFDYGHLTASGSAFVARQIRDSGALR